MPRESLTVHPGTNTFTREVVVKDPHLWWTWDLGAQNLYKLSATISPQAVRAQTYAQRCSDSND